MKQTLLIITALMLIVGCSKTIDVDKLVERGGLLYEVNSDKPFSGEGVSYYSNGQKKSEGTFKDGGYDGKWTYWYENGQIRSEETYKDGKEDGKWTRWHENGQKRSEGTYKDGERDRKWTDWYKNGQKKWEGTYKDGKWIKRTWWDEDGNKEQW